MKLLQIILILTFFLPFFPKRCSEPNEEQSNEQTYLDSLRVADSIRLADSLKLNENTIYPALKHQVIDEKKYSSNIQLSDSILEKSKSDDIISAGEIKSNSDELDSYSYELSKRNKFLKLLLRPDDKVTGVAYVMDSLPDVINYFGITIAFFLWIAALFLRLINIPGPISFNIVGLIVFYFTGFSSSIFLNTDTKLWGYWVTFSFALFLIIAEFFVVLKRFKRKASK